MIGADSQDRFGPNFRRLLRSLIRVHNPELAKEVGPLTIHDAVCRICERYGARAPQANDLVEPTSKAIFEQVKIAMLKEGVKLKAEFMEEDDA